MLLKAIFYWLPFAVVAVFCNDEDAAIVNTETGYLRGALLESRTGKRIYSFTGIPFAEPPLGRLRFEVRYVKRSSESIVYIFLRSDLVVVSELNNALIQFFACNSR